MTMESMTGQGRGTATEKGWRCVAECSSVNRKGIEIAVSIPKHLSTLEPRVREEVQRVVRRGRVNVTITVDGTAGESGTGGIIDLEAAKRAHRDLHALRQELSLGGEITLDLIMRSPGVLRSPADETPDPETLWPLVQQSLQQALPKMAAMRRREGAHLVADLLKRVKLLEGAAKAIRARVPSVLRQRRDQLRARLEELGSPVPANDPSVARELAIAAERSDITEELTRLESHFAQCREALAGTEPAGRTIDYLAQEMFREFNTLGNKAGDAVVSRRVVQSKAELDRIREQTANLE
jgi:uncharacterized protein (TIGR00255 family)